MAMAGLYRRILPSPPAVEFASLQGKVQALVASSLTPLYILQNHIFFYDPNYFLLFFICWFAILLCFRIKACNFVL